MIQLLKILIRSVVFIRRDFSNNLTRVCLTVRSFLTFLLCDVCRITLYHQDFAVSFCVIKNNLVVANKLEQFEQ